MFIMGEDGSKELGFLEAGSARLFAESIGLVGDNEGIFLYDERKAKVIEQEGGTNGN